MEPHIPESQHFTHNTPPREVGYTEPTGYPGVSDTSEAYGTFDEDEMHEVPDDEYVDVAASELIEDEDRAFAAEMGEPAADTAEFPGVITENPFKRGPDEPPEGWHYIKPEEMVANWGTYRDRNVAATRTFGAVAVAYHDNMHAISARGVQGADNDAHLLKVDALVHEDLEVLRATLRYNADYGAITSSLKEHLPDAVVKSELTNNGTRNIAEGIADLDDAQFLDFLRQRSVSVASQCKQMEAGVFEPMIAEFKERLAYAVNVQHLPLDLAIAYNRLDNVKVIYTDPLVGPGHFSSVTGVAAIGLHKRSDAVALQCAVEHELSHVLAGWEPIAHDERPGAVLNERSGLRQMGDNEPESNAQWLDESITDKLCVLLKDDTVDYDTLTYDDLRAPQHLVAHYVREEGLFDALLQGMYGSVMFKDVLAAHFENFDPTLPQGQRSPMQKALYAKLATAWGGYENIAPVIHQGDREMFGGRDYDPDGTPYIRAKILLGKLLVEYYTKNPRTNRS